MLRYRTASKCRARVSQCNGVESALGEILRKRISVKTQKKNQNKKKPTGRCSFTTSVHVVAVTDGAVHFLE